MRRVSGGSSTVICAVGEEQGVGPGKCSPLNSITSRRSSEEQLDAFLVLPADARLHALSLGLHELNMVMQAMNLEVPPVPPLPQDAGISLPQTSSPVASTSRQPLSSLTGLTITATSTSKFTPSPTRSPTRLATATRAPVASSEQAGGSSSGVATHPGSQPQPLQPQPPPQPQPVERQTQVVLPVAPDTTVPDWFYERTGAELKAEVQALASRRAAGEVLATRAWRERQAGAQASTSKAAVPQTLLLRVRFPEGVCLQGCFSGVEPTADVFGWVTESLRDPGLCYELIGPSRKPLQSVGDLRAAQDLWPAAILNFRPLGGELAMYDNLPYLKDELLSLTHAE